MSAFGFDPEDFPGWPSRRNRAKTVRLRPERPRRRWLLIVIGILVFLLAFGSTLLRLRVQLLFLDSLGHSNVFWTPLVAQLILFVIGAVLGGGLVAISIPFWRRAARNLDAEGPRVALLAGVALVVVVGLGSGGYLAGQWQDVLLWLHGHSFGAQDPVFNQDYSFFLFSLPVYDALQGIAWAAVLVTLLGAATVAALALSVEFAPKEVPIPLRPPAGRTAAEALRIAVTHAGAALAGVFVLAFLGAHFGVYHLATSSHDGYVGLDARERNVQRPVLGILQWLALLLAVVVIATLLRRRRADPAGTATMLGATLVGWLLVAGVAQAVPGLIYQQFSVNPNAQSAQASTISDFIASSRTAWALQSGTDVEQRQFGLPGQAGVPENLTVNDVRADPQTVANARIQDSNQLTDVFNQIDRSRQYQGYPTVTVDRYTGADGNTVEVMLSPREIAEGDIPNQSFPSRALQYTHGYGHIAVSATNVVNNGQPQVLVGGAPVKGAPGATPPPALLFDGKANDPGIYCGLDTQHPVVADTAQPEFDYPQGQGAHQSAGTGTVGVSGAGVFDRFAISLTEFGGTDLLLTDALRPQSRVLLHREIKERVQALAPFLSVDKDPYVVADPASGHLVWIADAYVKSDRFPLSYRQSDGTSYQRNAVKAVVDARTCATTLYALDLNEPITATWNEIYPGLLTPFSQMPKSLRAHLRYPEELLTAQSNAYAVVHIDPKNPDLLYTRSDAWRLAEEYAGTGANQSQTASQAYYVLMTLPGKPGGQPDFVLLQTFSPATTAGGNGSANNMTAWLAAQCDYTTTDHPKLIAVRLSNNDNVQGPLQFDNKINNDPNLSPKISLLNQNGSTVILGNVIILPFNNQSFLYVRPLYVKANGGSGNSYPLLRYVIVGGGKDQGVAFGTNLNEALHNLLSLPAGQTIPGLETAPATQPSPSPGASPGPSPGPSPGATPGATTVSPQAQQLLQQIATLRTDAAQAKAAGNFDQYLKDEEQIDKLIDQLNQSLGLGAPPSPGASPGGAGNASPSASPSPGG